MTSGIYKLKFDNGEEYVGKSVDIPRRWIEHGQSLSRGTASTRLQNVYDRWGPPEPSVLLECHPDHIGLMETVMVKLLDPTLNSADTHRLSALDYATLLDAEESVLKKSTAELIREIEELKRQVEEKDAEIYKITSTDAMSQRVAELEEEIEQLLTTTNKSWWRKIFG